MVKPRLLKKGEIFYIGDDWKILMKSKVYKYFKYKELTVKIYWE